MEKREPPEVKKLPTATAEKFDALANETRLRLFLTIHDGDGELPVHQVAERVGIKQNVIYNYITKLLLTGLIEPCRMGSVNKYRVTEAGQPFVPVVREIMSIG